MQWNARSLRANLPELLHAISRLHPTILAVQETWLKPHHTVRIPHYLLLRQDRPSQSGGGLAFFFSPHTRAYPIPTPTSTDEIQCLQITNPIHMRIINVYHPPGPLSPATLQSLDHLIVGPTLIVGDFNAHHPSWGTQRADTNGVLLSQWVQDLSLSILNDSSPTFFSRGILTSPDLSLATSDLLPFLSWYPHPHLLGSDHFPLLTSVALHSPCPPSVTPPASRPHWPSFRLSFPSCFSPPSGDSVDALAASLLTAIHDASSASRPFRPHTPRHPPLPWWTPTCTRAIRIRNQALQRARRSFNDKDWCDYKNKQAQARRTLRQSKVEYWHKICHSFSSNNKIRDLYRAINQIRGRRRDIRIHLLRKGNTYITNPLDIANELASHFTANSHHPFFPAITPGLPSPPPLHASYLNADITGHELRGALAASRDSAPGADGIRIPHLLHLPPDGFSSLLHLLNLSRTTGSLPSSWRHSIIIPIPKPCKPPLLPSSYRPIALTSNVCKLLERIINKRLNHYLESHHLLPPTHAGFRPFRSIYNHLAALSHDAIVAIHRHHYLAVALLDLHQAYDSVPHEAVMAKLFHLCGQGRLLTWIGELLRNRSCQVKVAQTLSCPVTVSRGLPQGSILSPTLFNVLLQDIPPPPTHNIHLAVYADDIALWSESTSPDTAINRLQDYLHDLHTWATVRGLQFSPTKSEYTLITHKNTSRIPPLYMADTPIPFSNKIRYLGTTFDSRLLWLDHLRTIQEKTTAAINALRCVTGLHWGTRRTTLLHLFRALVRPHIDQGACILPHSPRTLSFLQKLQNRALRICLGARRSTAIPSLHLEAAELPVAFRWKALVSSWIHRQVLLNVDPDHRRRWEQRDSLLFYRFSPSSIPPLLTAASFLRDQDLPDPTPLTPLPFPVPFTPLTDYATFLLPDSSGLSKSLPEAAVRATYYQLLADFPKHILLATDGAVHDAQAGAGIYAPQLNLRCAFRLPDGTSIATAELWALLYAFNSCPTDRPKIFITDSLSTLKSLLNDRHSPPNHLLRTLQLAIRTSPSPHHNVFMWVPSHQGIPPNEEADRLASQGRALPHPSFGTTSPLTILDCKRVLWNTTLQTWLRECAPRLTRHPHLLTSLPWPSLFFSSRSVETSLTRLRLGHSFLKASLARTAATIDDKCNICQVPETTEHYLLQCQRFTTLRQRTILAICDRKQLEPSTQTLLSFGSNSLGEYDHDVIRALDEFITQSHNRV